MTTIILYHRESNGTETSRTSFYTNVKSYIIEKKSILTFVHETAAPRRRETIITNLPYKIIEEGE